MGRCGTVLQPAMVRDGLHVVLWSVLVPGRESVSEVPGANYGFIIYIYSQDDNITSDARTINYGFIIIYLYTYVYLTSG